MSPSFNNDFDILYDEYSIKSTKFNIPNTVDFYLPDNEEDLKCTGVLVPNPEKKAEKYTYLQKIITIGIYRDEGRITQDHPIYENVYWYRSDKRLILEVQRPVIHLLLLVLPEIEFLHINV